VILDVGAGPGHFAKLVEQGMAGKVVMLDSSGARRPHVLPRVRSRSAPQRSCFTASRTPSLTVGRLASTPESGCSQRAVPVERIVADEEHLLETVTPNSQDAIVSCMSLHWINDLPGTLVQIREALRPDGVFLAAILGGDTLFELRTALQLAESEREGGLSPHVSPMTDTRDVTNLLGRAGFTLTTVDTDELQIAYPSMWELMDDLRDMGESNAVVSRRHVIHRDTLAAAAAIYKGGAEPP
jgi:NADH dehydrogenase [ubiquinone] 1 alpha subcomplex assembly factor 5